MEKKDMFVIVTRKVIQKYLDTVKPRFETDKFRLKENDESEQERVRKRISYWCNGMPVGTEIYNGKIVPIYRGYFDGVFCYILTAPPYEEGMMPTTRNVVLRLDPKVRIWTGDKWSWEKHSKSISSPKKRPPHKTKRRRQDVKMPEVFIRGGRK